jgi:hypothetical protein
LISLPRPLHTKENNRKEKEKEKEQRDKQCNWSRAKINNKIK